MNRTILIMAGGTGGHIYPGLAVADALHAQGWHVVWLGAPHSMEAEIVPKHGYPIAWVNFSGVRGKGLTRLLSLPFTLLRALGQSAVAIFQHRPDVVLGMGGYITLPGGLMAAVLRRPLIIHEQNSIAGMSNKVLAALATRVLSGFPKVLKNTLWAGNPVRAEIAALAEPQIRYAQRTGKLNVLVLGGSLGAQALNETLPKALASMSETERPNVLHQTGKKHFEAVQKLYANAGVSTDIRAFLEDMPQQYAQADLVICRAGALTIAELAAAGVASILIPFPFAVDDHQTHNALFLSEHGAAVLLPQPELSAEKLAQLIRDLNREKLATMAQAARSLAKPEATQSVVNVCVELAC
ncbi:MAG: undecaprenyldiphospho-muramoylpentapeptide beta-N-acetylglucosaminyltransferase [Gallionellaceae bacterium]|jgi:UDP-N-acetylglucosamine--N-acetylmuramyl-(pentapeptide) pyrophosphoryl-undecaprenol N-acetylglucosamine transferase